ncbi:aminotransferase class IV [uncultured Tateyamaria sp.]|uniref:aminotransferase class IV n=1 Tax=uncultured Tateyamaria sp. TaxID=455651 RepID=UPI002602E488|nr:aminotransferase class IV [uncultured Tateyamaria sp.]
MPEAKAQILIFDGAMQFGDAIYEVTAVADGRMLNFSPHMRRLERSGTAIDPEGLPSFADLEHIHAQLIRRKQLRDGLVYLQVSRGSNGDRDYYFRKETALTVILFTQSKPGFLDMGDAHPGLHVQLVPDHRWARCDIKSTQLLWPVLAKQRASNAGFDDAWFVQDGVVTEGTTNNAGIVLDGKVVTHPTGDNILAGTARASLVSVATALGMDAEERPFTVEEINDAEEAFITSSMNILVPVTRIDAKRVGNGTVGPSILALQAEMLSQMKAGCEVDAANSVP